MSSPVGVANPDENARAEGAEKKTPLTTLKLPATTEAYEEQSKRLWQGFKLSAFRALYILGFTFDTLLMIACDVAILRTILWSIDYLTRHVSEHYEIFGFNVHEILYTIEVVTLIVFAGVLAFKVLRHLYQSAAAKE
jgi:hypothetical protein